MELKYKRDFERARSYWRAFWNGAILDRPCLYLTAPKDGCTAEPPPYMAGFRDGRSQAEALETFERWAAATYFAAEAIPFCEISFGPDQFSGFLGAELIMAEDRATSWAVPCVENWHAAGLTFEEHGPLWTEMLAYVRRAAECGAGKFLPGMLDLHGHLDCLGALRGGQGLCLDIMDRPDEVLAALAAVRSLYPAIYARLFEAGKMGSWGSIGWAPFYCEGKFATIQCDYICLLSPRQARRFALPAIAEEAAYLDRCVYHYDGPAALVHLDDILAIEAIDVIQWVPGDGQPPMIEWLDLLKRIQRAGKGLQIGCSAEEVKLFHRELRPEKVLYVVRAASERAADELLAWLVKET